jgi:hypothetical protein
MVKMAVRRASLRLPHRNPPRRGTIHSRIRLVSPCPEGRDIDFGSVTAFPLGGVQGSIRTSHDGATIVVPHGLGDTHAEGVRQVVPTACRHGGGEALPEPIEDAQGLPGPGTGKDQQELLAAHPAQHILSPDPPTARVGEVPEHDIARVVCGTAPKVDPWRGQRNALV